MLGRTVFAATFLALAQFTVATPPGCLLGAVNEYSDPSDVKSVCKSKDLESKVKQFCGDDTEAAMKAVKEMCGDAGDEVSSASGSGSAYPTKSSTPSKSSSESATHVTVKATGTAPAGHGSAHASGSVGTLVSMYPTGSGGHGRNGTAPTATGGPKSPTSPNGANGANSPSGTTGGDASEASGAAGKVEFGVAAIVAGLMAVAL